MKQQHTDSEINLFHGGVDSDHSPESLERKEGSVIDSVNMRPNSLGTTAGSRQKIHGEEILYPNIDNRCPSQGGTGSPLPLTYECIAVTQVLGNLVEFWADRLGVGVPYVRVNGWVVCMPLFISDFPISVNYPPQIHQNDSCVGGEVFYTDNSGICPPFYLNVQDMLNNAGVVNNIQNCDNATSKYYAEFNIDSYSINTLLQLDHPVFVEVTITGSNSNVLPNAMVVNQSGGGGSGMTPGKYQYSYQFVDATGNVTNFVPFSPVVSMPINFAFPNQSAGNWEEDVYPGSLVFGGAAATTLSMHLSMHIRFRITNLLGYVSVNVRRVSWKSDAANGSLGIDEIVSNFNILGGATIVDFFDNDNSSITPTPTQESSGQLAAVNAAKGIRYYAQRLNLMNITYESQDINVSLPTPAPFVRSLGFEGYKDLWNEAYRKSNMRGELYNQAWVGFDSQGNSTFAGTPVNLTMPNRRDALTGASLTASIEAQRNPNVLTAVNSAGAVTQTFEVFDCFSLQQRDKTGQSISLAPGGTSKSIVDNGSIAVKGFIIDTNIYQPFRPVSQTNQGGTPYEGFNYLPQAGVNDGTITDGTILGATHGYGQATNSPGDAHYIFPNYNPVGFAPDLYALGTSYGSVTGIPNYISAFTIVRSAPANRVVAQAQSFYSLDVGHPISAKDNTKLVFQSPDLYTTMASFSTANKIQFVSPLGMFSETFSASANNSLIINSMGSSSIPSTPNYYPATKIDMICYPRIMSDTNGGQNNLINTTSSGAVQNMDTTFPANGRYYTGWSSWRNTPTGNITPNLEEPITTINAVATLGQSPRQDIYQIDTGYSIYAQTGAAGNYDFKDAGVAAWQEPMYVVNIVNDSAVVPTTNVQSYYQTECYVKVQSIIGISDGVSISYPLVDERWQDCIPALLSTDWNASFFSFIWIKNPNTNIVQPWLNVTYTPSSTITQILSDIAAFGYHLIADACYGSVKIYGIYTHTITPAVSTPTESNMLYTIVLNYSVPSAGDYIVVQYDPCTTIEVFGGDTYIGEYNYPVIDGDNGGVNISTPLPYRSVQLNEQTVIIENQNDTSVSNAGGLELQSWNVINLTIGGGGTIGAIRQLICNGIIESRTNTAMGYPLESQKNFPLTNYIQRPLNFDASTYTNNIAPPYFTDYNSYLYPNSFQYGGFAVYDQTNNGLTYNNDYSENPNNNIFTSKPATGFIEKLNYCTRAIWSTQRSTAQENTPNLKNFPTTNIYDFDDACGEIKFAWDTAVGGLQGNLYAFTEIGIVMAETNKSILTEISGNQLAVIGGGNDQFIQNEVWKSRTIGMNDEMWRSKAEYNNEIWFANKNSVYRFNGGEISEKNDIGSYNFSTTTKNVLNNIAPGYGSDVTAIWYEKYKEYILQTNTAKILITGIGEQFFYSLPNAPSGTEIFADSIIDYQSTGIMDIESVFIGLPEFFVINNSGSAITVKWSATNSFFLSEIGKPMYRIFYDGTGWNYDGDLTNSCDEIVWAEDGEGSMWNGKYTYFFDKYNFDVQGNIYGARYGATYNIDTGYTLYSQAIHCYATAVCNPQKGFAQGKNFWYIGIASDFIPDYVNFYDNMPLYYINSIHSTIDTSVPYALKNYNKWSGYIPRSFTSPYYHVQGRYSIYQIKYAKATEWNLSNSEVSWKELK